MSALIDLHAHSWPRSQCSSLRPEDVLRLAAERGLDAVCFTEHDAWWPEDELATLRRVSGMAVFAGVELTTDLGHVLAFGLPPPTAPLVTADAAFEAAREAGALLFLAHPARDGLLRVDHRTVTRFDSVETVNGSDSRLQNLAAAGLAKAFRLPGIGGSDAHTAAEVGRAATRFPRLAADNAELLALLRTGEYEAAWNE